MPEPADGLLVRTSATVVGPPACLASKTENADPREDRERTTEDTDFLTDMELPERPFASRREFMCYGYLSGSARVSTRQYDVMREAENSSSPVEAWPCRSGLDLIRRELMKHAPVVKTQTTTRHLPTGKGRALRCMSDASVRYKPFSEHIKRDFADAASAQMFRDKGDSDVGTVDSPTEFYQTVVASDPSSKNFRSGFRLNGVQYTVGCTVSAGTQRAERLDATLIITDNGDDGDVTVSRAVNASPASLRVGDFVATFLLVSATDGLVPFLRPDGTFLLRFYEVRRNFRPLCTSLWRSYCR